MGKLAKKGKMRVGDVALMEVPESPVGVRTRAKTLALQQNSDLCYLQLRSRRLHKPQFLPPSLKKPTNRNATGSRLCAGTVNSVPAHSPSPTPSNNQGPVFGTDVDVSGLDASFGDNHFHFDQSGRGTRESTPCSGTAYRIQTRNYVQRSNPLTYEMEEFFASAEMQQKQHFMDKFNYDVVNDLPLSGRYDWVRIDP